jgi:nucleoside-diphosphate-sugar epimerase
MSCIVIFGGTGYIGMSLARYWLKSGRATQIVLADIVAPKEPLDARMRFVRCDVREPIAADLAPQPVSWIFNFAAVHREPGHAAHEYFDTNLKGARNVCDFAERVGCDNICFTSSISVYGPSMQPSDESARLCPTSPYGGSKAMAELIHQLWLERSERRRLIMVRPGVVFGPHDPGNIGRMVQAIRRGYFAFPGSTNIHKSYAYIYGLLESIDFVIDSGERCVVYNYVETPTETLKQIADETKAFVGSRAPILSLPASLLIPVAHVVQFLRKGRSSIHPVRVRKAGMPTHIVPRRLKDMGFEFRYPFAKALEHWAMQVPSDFGRERYAKT